jgi:hypothetical protein
MTRLATIAAVALVGTANAFTREFFNQPIAERGIDTYHSTFLLLTQIDVDNTLRSSPKTLS